MKTTHSKEEKLKAAMEVVNKGILTKPKSYIKKNTIDLSNRTTKNNTTKNNER